jgi:hypothetical protein
MERASKTPACNAQSGAKYDEAGRISETKRRRGGTPASQLTNFNVGHFTAKSDKQLRSWN